MNFITAIGLTMLIIFFILSPLYIAFFIIKLQQNQCKNINPSIEMMSMISNNDTGCNIEATFAALEESRINTSFNYKIS